MVARENYGSLDFGAKPAPQKKQSILVFEESTGAGFDSSADPTSFLGYREEADSGMHNYALMIYDKKKQGFRLVPVESHIRFEKKKSEKTRENGQGLDKFAKSLPSSKGKPLEAPVTRDEKKLPTRAEETETEND